MLLAYSLVSGETIAGSAKRSSLGVIPSGPAALFAFRALIFLDTDSSGIEQEEIVCTGEPSLLIAFRVQLGFLEISIPTVANKTFIRFAFSLSRTVSVLSSRLIGPICCLLLGFAALESQYLPIRSSWFRGIYLFTKESTLCSSQVACYLIPDFLVIRPGNSVFGVHGGLKKLIPVIHLSPYFISNPRVAFTADFDFF